MNRGRSTLYQPAPRSTHHHKSTRKTGGAGGSSSMVSPEHASVAVRKPSLPGSAPSVSAFLLESVLLISYGILTLLASTQNHFLFLQAPRPTMAAKSERLMLERETGWGWIWRWKAFVGRFHDASGERCIFLRWRNRYGKLDTSVVDRP
jgi:hypothetical protein